MFATYCSISLSEVIFIVLRLLKVVLFTWNKANKFIWEDIHAHTYIHITVISGSIDELISWQLDLKL